MIRLLHTADLHLGLKFTRGYAPSVRDRLVGRRLECLRDLVDLANSRSCHVMVVAGDLFDHPRVPKGLIREAAGILARFEGIVAVLPGNHDYVQEEDPVWPVFVDALGERHHLLRRETPCDLRDQGVPLVLFPGVCGSRHSKSNAVGWIPEALAGLDLPSGVRRVGVAHGSLEGLSPDFEGDYFPMTRGELEAMKLDAWLLGHTHVRFPDRDRTSGDRIFYPATPEPDGFDCRHGGHAWILELDEAGKIEGESVRTGRFRFRSLARSLSTEAEVEALRVEVASFNPERDLLKLELTGRLPGHLYENRSAWLAGLEKSVLYFESDTAGLLREITTADIDREYSSGSFPHRLLSELGKTAGEEGALQVAWDLVMESRS